MYYVLAIAGCPIVLSSHGLIGDALRGFGTLRRPSVVARVEGAAVEVIAVKELLATQLGAALLEALTRVYGRVPSET
jgi:hypothetical protein